MSSAGKSWSKAGVVCPRPGCGCVSRGATGRPGIVGNAICAFRRTAIVGIGSPSRCRVNSAWLVCAAMAFNLTRTSGALAPPFHARATSGTIRAQLVNVPGRLARSARQLVLHLPTGWPWETAWTRLADTARHGQPTAA